MTHMQPVALCALESQVWIKSPPPLASWETLEATETDLDGYPAYIIRDSRDGGYYRLRQWDKTHGWGDRSYKTLERVKEALKQ
jgi:hypothetical protein